MRPVPTEVASRADRRRRRPDSARKTASRRAALEALEPRTLMAVLPTPQVLGQFDASNRGGIEFQPSIAVDPTDPLHAVTVYTSFSPVNNPRSVSTIGVAYTTDGGRSWQSVAGPALMGDPTTNNPRQVYAQNFADGVGFDRQGNFYVLSAQYTGAFATNQPTAASVPAAGSLVLTKYSFAGGAPSRSFDNVVYQYFGGVDGFLDPVLAVDSSVASFTDTNDSRLTLTQSDKFTGNVYVGWTKSDTAPARVTDLTNYNPNRMTVLASSDGGRTFSGLTMLNDAGNFGTERDGQLSLTVGQGTGDGRVPGGQLTTAWVDTGSLATASPPRNIVQSDRIQNGASAYTAAIGGGTIKDATDPGNNMPHIPGVTDFPIDVSIADPRFVRLSDLDVKVDLVHPNLDQLKIELVPPSGSGLPVFTLLQNQTDPANNTNKFVGISGANMGVLTATVNNVTIVTDAIGTTFDDQATRDIVDINPANGNRGAAAPFIGHFQPEGGSLDATYGGATAAQINGTWTLRITDTRSNGTTPPVQFLDDASLIFTSGFTAGADSRVATTAAVVGPLTNSPNVPIATAPSLASDNTLGAFSPYQGRLYVAYVDRLLDAKNTNPVDNTDIFLKYSDDGGQTWNGPIKVNDDSATSDGFSEDNADLSGGLQLSGRPQFQPQVAVDPATGTLVASWYDARYSADRNRVAYYVGASIDGGNSFGPETFVNQAKTATDAVTGPIGQGRMVTLGPVPDNFTATANGAANTPLTTGRRQGLAVLGGRVYPAWSSNQDARDTSGNRDPLEDIRVAPTLIAGGPRIIDSTMGPVGLPGDTLNNTRGADGGPVAQAFVVTFDRLVDPSSFTPADVRVFFRDTLPNNPSGGPVPVVSVTPLDLGSFGPAGAHGATKFRVNFAPRSAVGTYSYTVGPGINDRIRSAAPLGSSGNAMDQNANGTEGEPSADVYAAPSPLSGLAPNGSPQAPFDQDTLPLIVPGPHLLSTAAVGPDGKEIAPTNGENLALNATVTAVDVTFDRDMNPATFGAAQVLRVVGPYGTVPGPYTVTPAPKAGEDRNFPRTYRVGFPTQQLSGTYVVTLASSIQSKAGNALDTNLNAGLDLLRGTRAAATAPITYNSADTPTPIPDGGSVSSKITVTDSFVVQGASLTLNITHPNDPDLQAYLLAPDGVTKIQLFTHIGATGTRANFINTTFSVAPGVTTPIQNGGPPFNGTFLPQQGLDVLNGRLSAGTYTLVVQDDAAGSAGVLLNWSLTLLKPLPSSGLGEPSADVATASFRIFTMDPTNPLSSNTWTAVGPADIGGGGNPDDPESAAGGRSGRIGGLAVDPSDPSGNTVYVGGASGGIWKTTNFLAPGGPTYIPLTDFGPTFGINIGGIAVFGRNDDPNQSIIFAATGEGDTGSQGVGFLRSMDGGATWTLLDSTDNTLPFDQRDHAFAKNGGTQSFKVVVDPTMGPQGVIVYAAISGNNGGLWRSLDSGMHWQNMRAGQATDVVLDPDSATGGNAGTLQFVYAAFRGDGVYFSPNQGQVWNLMAGGVGDPLIQDLDRGTNPVNVAAPAGTPNGAKGRIVLAKPDRVPDTDPNAREKNLIYQGWLYAAVITPDSHFDGLYMTKDFGQNWVKLRIPTLPPVVTNGVAAVRAVPSNDIANADYDIGGGPAGTGLPPQGNYDVSLAIDPTDPNVVYLGGTADGQPTGFLRIDATTAYDAHALVPFDANSADGGLLLIDSKGGVSLDDPVNLPKPAPYLNLIRDPVQPFSADATIFVRNSNTFTNNGANVKWTPFDIGGTDQHRIVTIRDPLTGHARIIIGDDQGVFTAVDNDGTMSDGIGTAPFADGSRNGNLQITQFYYGAAQPSNLAAQVAGALFYGSAQDNGGPVSGPGVLSGSAAAGGGGIVWNGPGGDATGVATDQQGSGTLYQFWWPCCGGNKTDFFRVNGVGRTFGLIQASNPGPTPDPQWPPTFGANFAVNPLRGGEADGQVIISSAAGRIFGTENAGRVWSVIGNPSALDGTYAPALAYGAPDPNGPNHGANLDDFLYAGTSGGNIFVTQTGGGGTGNDWTRISTGLDGSAVQAIVTNPTRGSHEAYAVTLGGVYHIADSTAAGAAWTKITGNLFDIEHSPFGDATLANNQLGYLTSIVADWRYVIPDADGSGTHPMLYVGGEAGVYRSSDDGATWTLFPAQDADSLNTTPTPPGDGGGLPLAHVTDLDMALGNIDPTTGRPDVSTGPNVLLASTYGRGSFAVRLAPFVFADRLALDTAQPPPGGSDSGASNSDHYTNVNTPVVDGLSEESAFGNVVYVTLYDVTDPSNPVFIGGYNPADPSTKVAANQTGPTGQFSVRVSVPLADGPHRIGVQATDLAGTRGNMALLAGSPSLPAAPAGQPPYSIVVDTARPLAPAAPDLQDASDTGISSTDNITRATSPIFDVALANEPDTTKIFLTRDGQVVASGFLSGGKVSLPDPGPVPDGVHTYRAYALDLAGNMGPTGAALTVTVDTKPPTRPASPVLDQGDSKAVPPRPSSDSGTPGDNITNVARPNLTGTAEPGGFALLIDSAGGIIGSAPVGANGIYLVRPTSDLADGTYALRVRAEDVAGNFSQDSPPIQPALQIITRPPAAPTIRLVSVDDTGVPADNITKIRTPRFTGTAPVGLKVQLVLGADLVVSDGKGGTKVLPKGTAVGNPAIASNGTYIIQFPDILPANPVNAQVLLNAEAIDAAGNTTLSDQVANNANPADPLAVTIDTTAPTTVPTLALAPADDTGAKGDGRTSARRPHLVGSVKDPNVFVDLVDSTGRVLATGVSTFDGSYSLQMPSDLANGSIALTVRVRDVAGNQGPPSPVLKLTIGTTPGDYDGDGRADLATYQATTGTWSILRSTAGPTIPSFGGPQDVPLQGDFDGDGRVDLAVYREAPAPGQASVWFIDRSRSGGVAIPFGTKGDIAVPGDYDGDGVTDLALYRPSTAQWFALLSGGGVISTTFGAPGRDKPVPADYDGDGKTDLAVYRPDTAQWFILRSSAGPEGLTFGAPNTDIPVPSDYDGDGKADVGVYRPGTGQWLVIKSGGGVLTDPATGKVPVVGSGGDVPAPLDYDGDGKTDPAVFRPTTGQWTILQSSNDALRRQTLGNPGDIPAPSSFVARTWPTLQSRSLGFRGQAFNFGQQASALSAATFLAPPNQEAPSTSPLGLGKDKSRR